MSSATSGTAAEPDPDAVAAAVLACPAVAALSVGVAGEVATYLPGRRVNGIRFDDRTVTVHVVGRWGPTMAEIGDQVSRAVTPLAAGRAVDVVIDDLDLTGGVGAGAAPVDPLPALPATTSAVD